ncbi:tetratricopeptide repeat protein [Daejeonella sp.]|uniref:tetratricopeptide repeat protein n=1 Tax=Daejeonella sp. TaxID=2805397 RepID=UPI0039834BC3
MKRIFIFLFSTTLLFIAPLRAQTVITKDAMNSFIKYTGSNDIKDLEAARKLIDDGYKNKSDSNAFKNNLIRSLVYSALAHADSNLRLKYPKDPVDIALHSLKNVSSSKSASNAVEEIGYIDGKLKQTYLYRANSSFRERRFNEALRYFSILDSLEKNNYSITHNLAFLNQELGNYERSSFYFIKLISQKSKPEYLLILASLYESMGDESNAIKTLKSGSDAFPDNRDLVFKLINLLSNRNDYLEIAKFADRALKLDEFNIDLNYLAGFSNEMIGGILKAEKYYKAVLNINPNNYEGNYALGLLYLNLYLKDPSKTNMIYISKFYLSKANEIDPNELKSLTSLLILYKHTGDKNELQKINNRINQLKLN